MKSKLSIAILFSLMQALSVFGQSETLTISIPEGTLEGTLLKPASPKGVVLIIAGSGPTDRDGNNPLIAGKNNSLLYLAEHIHELGWITLRYDKRGIGASKVSISEEDLSFEDFIDDAVAWITELTNKFRGLPIVIAGHSEGALIGLEAAIRTQADGYISLTGSGLSLDKTIAKQLANQPDMVKKPSMEIMEKLLQGETVDDIPPFLMTLFRPSVQPFLINLFQYDPAKLIAAYSGHVLIVQGGLDIQVDDENGEILSKAQPNARFAYIADMNHVLKQVADKGLSNQQAYSNPDLPLHPDLKEALRAFLQM